MSKRLELNLNMSFFKEDWAFKIDFSKCKNFEDLFKYLDNVIIEDINVGEQFRKMYTFPENCPLLDTFIPFRGFTTNPENEIGIDGSFERKFLDILNDIRNTSGAKDKNKKLFDFVNLSSAAIGEVILKIINLTYSTYYTYNVSLSALKDITEPYNGIPNYFLDTLKQLEYVGLNDSGEILPGECKTIIRKLYTESNDFSLVISRFSI
jgi:hypothetical protein